MSLGWVVRVGRMSVSIAPPGSARVLTGYSPHHELIPEVRCPAGPIAELPARGYLREQARERDYKLGHRDCSRVNCNGGQGHGYTATSSYSTLSLPSAWRSTAMTLNWPEVGLVLT